MPDLFKLILDKNSLLKIKFNKKNTKYIKKFYKNSFYQNNFGQYQKKYSTTKHNPDILESTHGRLPVVTISTQLGDRMEATVRHNRARGRHSVAGMAGMVFQLLEEGYTEDEVMDRLGMEAAEVARLKHITGFAKLLEDHEYTNALVSKRQILMAKEAGEKVL